MRTRLKHACTGVGQYGANIPATSYSSDGVRFLRTTDILESGGVTPAKEGVFVPPGLVDGYLLEPGDLLFSRSGTLGRAYLHTSADSPSAFAGYLVRFRPRQGVLPAYAFYASRATPFLGQIEADAVQSTIANFNAEKYGNVTFWLPTPEKQARIVSYLDDKTQAIDALIAEKQTLLDLLAEKRAALINRAVTRGLDPGVPLKDSGIESIGKIPAHWSMSRLKYVVSHIVDCHHSTPTYEPEGEYPAIRTADVFPGFLDVEGARTVDSVEYHHRISRLKPRAGDIVFSREGERWGMAAPVPENIELCLAQRVMVFRVRSGLESEFIMWVLNASATRHQLACNVVGATSPHVNIGDIRELRIAVPPRAEQRTLAEHIREHCVQSASLLVQLNNQIERLKDYRQSLITAAVTGQLDIP